MHTELRFAVVGLVTVIGVVWAKTAVALASKSMQAAKIANFAEKAIFHSPCFFLFYGTFVELI
jgi:hypothetical protein